MALQEHFGVSERRACVVTGQHRSTQRCIPRPRRSDETRIRRRLRRIAKTHPRWGWRKAHDILLREGYALNKKRTRRLWRQEGLRRPPTCKKRRRLHVASAERRAAARPNEVKSSAICKSSPPEPHAAVLRRPRCCVSFDPAGGGSSPSCTRSWSS